MFVIFSDPFCSNQTSRLRTYITLTLLFRHERRNAVSIIHDIVMTISLLTYYSSQKRNKKYYIMLHSSTTTLQTTFGDTVY